MKWRPSGLFAKIVIWSLMLLALLAFFGAAILVFHAREANNNRIRFAHEMLEMHGRMLVEEIEAKTSKRQLRKRFRHVPWMWLFDVRGDTLFASSRSLPGAWGHLPPRPMEEPGEPSEDIDESDLNEGLASAPSAATMREPVPRAPGRRGGRHGLRGPGSPPPPRSFSITFEDVRAFARACREDTVVTLEREHADGTLLSRKVAGSQDEQYLAVLFVPRKSLLRPFMDLHRHAPVRWILLMIGVVGGMCFWLARHLVAPIVEMQRVSRFLGQGDLQARLPESLSRRFDELGALVVDFNRMAESLERVMNDQRRLLRDISHELRTPLARMQIALELLREAEGEERTDLTAKIERNLCRLNELIQQVLDVTRLERLREQPMTFAELDLARLVETILTDVRFEAELKDVRIQADLAMTQPRMNGSAEFLRRAIVNVLRNAVRHSPRASVVEFQATQQADEILLRVADQGPGVPEESLSRLFEPFFRAETERTPDNGGFGLGLTIVKRAIEAHGGSVAAANRTSGGLEILLRLPSSKEFSLLDQQQM